MTHISRPLQIVLVAFVLFVALWFVVLRGHSSSGVSSGSSASTSVHSQSSQHASGSAPATGASGGKTLPGVAGLTRAIDKARGAVAQSQRNAHQLQQQANAASGAGSAQSGSSTSTGSPSRVSRAAAPGASSRSKPATPLKAAAPKATVKTATGAPAGQALVEGELAKGQTVIVLFWNPAGTVDAAVRKQVQLLGASHKGHGNAQNRHIAVHVAQAGEVGNFGTITHSLQVFQTPTILVIAPSGSTKTLTGLVDAYTIQQAIKEARHP
jgi:hypothetical protein